MCSDLLKMTCQVANVLRSKGIQKGDVVVIYLPTMPLAVASMLACARIGAVHWYTNNRLSSTLCMMLHVIALIVYHYFCLFVCLYVAAIMSYFISSSTYRNLMFVYAVWCSLPLVKAY